VQPRGSEFRVHDIFNAIAAISACTDGTDFAGFSSDRKTVDAVVRNIVKGLVSNY
jgi:uncharacterized protein with HEPN domain